MANILEKQTYGDIINQSTSLEEFLSAIEAAYPRDLILNYDKIKAFAEYKYPPEAPLFFSPFATVDFTNVYEPMVDWVREQLPMPIPDPRVNAQPN